MGAWKQYARSLQLRCALGWSVSSRFGLLTCVFSKVTTSFLGVRLKSLEGFVYPQYYRKYVLFIMQASKTTFYLNLSGLMWFEWEWPPAIFMFEGLSLGSFFFWGGRFVWKVSFKCQLFTDNFNTCIQCVLMFLHAQHIPTPPSHSL